MAFVLKIALALSTHGSTDILLFEGHLAKLRTDGAEALYREGISMEWCGPMQQRPCPPFNHPPFMVRVLEVWGALAVLSSLPFGFWLRFTCAVADVVSLVLVWQLCGSTQRHRQAQIALVLFAVCPIALLISGFHGNTDPILMMFVLLAVWLLDIRRPTWLAGVALGMAMNVKIVPVLLLPAVLLSLSGSRRKAAFLAGAVPVFLIGSLPLLLTAPELMMTRVLGYSSQSGLWGFSLLASVSRVVGLAWLYDFYVQHGTILSVSFVLGATLWPPSRARDKTLFMRVGFVLFVFISSTPGFGVQYLTWLLPWTVALGVWPTATYYLAGMVFLFAYYTAAAAEFPWYIANSLERPAWTGTVLSLGLICWVVICGICLIYYRSLRARSSLLASGTTEPKPGSSPVP